MLGVFLLQRRQQLLAQAAHLSRQLTRLLTHGAKAVKRQRCRQVVQHAADIDPGRSGANQQRRIDGRFEERELLDLTFDVHAVSDLEEPIRDRIPPPEDLLVSGHAEEEVLQRATVEEGG